MEYELVKNKTRKSFLNYRKALRKFKANNIKTIDKRLMLEANLLDFASAYFQKYSLPITLTDIAKDVYPEEPQLLRAFIGHHFGNAYEFFSEAKIWRGEPLEFIPTEEEEEEYKVLVSERFPVVFSHYGFPSDIAWMPLLSEPDEKVAEAMGILLSSSILRMSPRSENVDVVRIKRKPHEMVYLNRHVIPLLARIFNVPEGFFRYKGIKFEESAYGKSYKPQLEINSMMFGSYFQQVCGIFEIRNDKPRKKRPSLELNKEQKKSFLRGVMDCKSEFSHSQLTLRGSEFLLSLTKDYAQAIGIDFSPIRPRLSSLYKLTVVEKTYNKAKCQAEKSASIGDKVFSFFEGKINEVGIIKEQVKGERWKREGIPDFTIIELFKEPKGELYQEIGYAMHRRIDEGVIEDIGLQNPYRLLYYLEARGDIPKVARDEQVQEFVYEKWDEERSLRKLSESVRNFLSK